LLPHLHQALLQGQIQPALIRHREPAGCQVPQVLELVQRLQVLGLVQ
jgi:hypothetical protein